MTRGFTGTTQKPSSSRLKGRAHHLHIQKRQDKFAQMWIARSLFFFRRSRNCAIWICSTRTNCKPPLLRWHLTAFAGKCATKRTWKVEFGFVHHDSAPARCAVCVNYWVKTKCHSTHTLLARFSTAWLLFPELEIALQGRRFNDVTMIQAKSQDALGECHTMHFTKFFEGWRVCWARIIYDADYSERGAAIAQSV